MIKPAIAMLVLASIAGGGAVAANDHDQTAQNSDGCKIVHLKPGESPPTSLSSSVSAGNGHVSAQTNVGGPVAVHSGNGAVSTSVATTTGSGGTTTTVTSDGGCTVYLKPGQNRD